MSLNAREIRSQLGHPVVDADGHVLESIPLLADYLRQEAGPAATDEFVAQSGFVTMPSAESHWAALAEQTRKQRRPAAPWWGSPTEAVDRATAFAPALLAERLEELGLDFSILYPSVGLMLAQHADDAMRIGGCRALNAYLADFVADHAERLTAAAMIPMVTPQEAIETIDHAVDALGLRCIAIASWVRRAGPEGPYADVFGIDCDLDYDPVWQHCLDRGVAITAHGGSMGFGFRQSPSRYMYNHVGHFAAASEALAKALFFGGVTHRFPDLAFAFLEGGVAWGAQLLADLMGRWDKRGGRNIRQLDLDRLDRGRFDELLSRYGGEAFSRADVREQAARMGLAHPAELDEFHRCGIVERDDLPRRFVPSFYFGCEADDPFVGLAYDDRLIPGDEPLRPLFGSDVGHWDVSEMCGVLPEAFELVEKEILDADRFRAFAADNAIKLHTSGNPGFFDGTAVEAYARECIAAEDGPLAAASR